MDRPAGEGGSGRHLHPQPSASGGHEAQAGAEAKVRSGQRAPPRTRSPPGRCDDDVVRCCLQENGGQLLQFRGHGDGESEDHTTICR